MKIGIISPAAGSMNFFPKRVERGVSWLCKQGWKPIFGQHALLQQGYVSAAVLERVDDIHNFIFSDVDIILASIGGYNSNQLLPYLNYNKIRNADKIFCGYSDVTALLLAIAVKSGSRCIYGPTFLPEICEYPEPYKITVDSFKQALSGDSIVYECPQKTVSEYIDWAEEEKGNCRKKRMKQNKPWRILQKGKAHGPIWGGNLQTLLWVLGTEYFPLSVLDGAIFFFEDLEENPAILDAMLQSLKLRGVFERISGLIVGRFSSLELSEQMYKLIPSVVNNPEIPILCDVDIGHVNPMLSIPLGRKSNLCIEKDIYWEVESF